MKVVLPGSAMQTTRLGFGTAGLHGGPSMRDSLQLLETAFEHGIRHFDTAPLYGLGAAERVLGEFLARRQAQVSVTTKYGLLPPKAGTIWNMARLIMRPLVSRMPALKRRLVEAVATPAPPRGVPSSLPRFSPAGMRASLEASLRALGRDRIEVFLLHDAGAADLTDELRACLDKTVIEGLVGAWGLGSGRDDVVQVAARDGRPPAVVQFRHPEPGIREPGFGNAMVITHGVVSHGLGSSALADDAWRQRLARFVDFDIESPGTLARLLMAAALETNPEGIVLFTSKRVSHIREMCRLLIEDHTQSGRSFVQFLRQERCESTLEKANGHE